MMINKIIDSNKCIIEEEEEEEEEEAKRKQQQVLEALLLEGTALVRGSNRIFVP